RSARPRGVREPPRPRRRAAAPRRGAPDHRGGPAGRGGRLLRRPPVDVAPLASAEGPARVEVEGIGDFWRERLPANRLPIIPPSPHDGWLPRLADLPEVPSPVRDLVVGETHRY